MRTKQKDKIKIILVIIILLVLLSTSVFAIGLRPAKTVLKSIPNETTKFPFFIINDEEKDIEVKVYPEGPLSSYVNFERNTYQVGPDGRELYFTLDLPIVIPPGENAIDIVIEPQELWFRKSQVFSAKLRIVHKLFISGEIPDKYIKAYIEIENYENYMEIKATVKNHGREKIDYIQPELTITDANKIVEQIELPSKSLKRGNSETFSKKIPTLDYTAGEYQLNALIEYDDQSLSLYKLFRIGNPNINVRKWDEYLKFDDINEFAFELQNKWNRAIENINAEITIYRNEIKIKNSKTEMFTLKSNEQKKIINFLDVRGLVTGVYDAVLEINYLNQQVRKEFQLEILADENYAKKSKNKDGESDNGLQYIILLILTINISAMVLVMILSMRNQRRSQGYEPIYNPNDFKNFK